MHYDRNVFRNQLPTVNRFVSHLTYYQILNKGYTERRLRNDFWYITIEAHLFAATMNWCKVFGSDDCNPTHWKKLSENQLERFRKGLFQETGLDEKRWHLYWTSMTDFRNKFVAHRELHFEPTPPNFDTALAAAYYYDEWVRKIISPDTINDPPLAQFRMSLEESVPPLVDKLLGVTEQPRRRGGFLDLGKLNAKPPGTRTP
jgi:hypothetical protein